MYTPGVSELFIMGVIGGVPSALMLFIVLMFYRKLSQITNVQ